MCNPGMIQYHKEAKQQQKKKTPKKLLKKKFTFFSCFIRDKMYDMFFFLCSVFSSEKLKKINYTRIMLLCFY